MPRRQGPSRALRADRSPGLAATARRGGARAARPARVVGVAAGLGFRLPGFDIVFVERLPSAAAVPGSIAPTGSGSAGAPPTAGAQRNLGSPIPVSDAVVLDRPRVLVPASMPTPDAAYVIGAGDRRIVTLAWRAEPGQARLPSSDLALTVMAVPGDIDDSLIKKIATPDTSVALVSVNGDRGWWISGAPHELLIERPDGQVGSIPAAIAGDTLVFARDGTLYRLESSLGRDATVAIAEGLR